MSVEINNRLVVENLRNDDVKSISLLFFAVITSMAWDFAQLTD